LSVISVSYKGVCSEEAIPFTGFFGQPGDASSLMRTSDHRADRDG